jgi:DNA-binding NarL/FixJ family response regulator
MPDLNGIEATRQILASDPRVKVIALSMHVDRRYVSEMLAAGAAGYLVKHCAMDELQQAIEVVRANKTYVSPEVAGALVEDYLRYLPKEQEEQPLTAREREVLQLIAEGESTKEIAVKLHVSIPTVETHRQHIMDKLKLYTVAELTKYAIRHGISPLE